MTREDAIRELKIFSGTTKTRLSANFWKALEMAIKALSEEPCEDAVSNEFIKKHGNIIIEPSRKMDWVVKDVPLPEMLIKIYDYDSDEGLH